MMDTLLPYGLVLFGVTGAASAICALFASSLGLGAASEIWAMAKVCGYLFTACAVILFIYRQYQEDLERQRHVTRKRRR